MSEEKQLIQDCISGDRHAQKLFFTKYFGKIMIICFRYTDSRETAKDLAQEVMMKVFDHLDTFKFGSSISTWMTRIAINHAISWNKKNQRMHFTGIEEDFNIYDDEEPEEEITPEQIILIIQQMPPGYRTVLNLYAIEKYTHAEIAGLLGISEGTSKSQLSKARKLLKEKVAQYIHLKTNM